MDFDENLPIYYRFKLLAVPLFVSQIFFLYHTPYNTHPSPITMMYEQGQAAVWGSLSGFLIVLFRSMVRVSTSSAARLNQDEE